MKWGYRYASKGLKICDRKKAILGSISGACADTWASEIGSVLFYSTVRRKAKEEDFKLRQERLPKCHVIVWPMKKDPRGANSGINGWPVSFFGCPGHFNCRAFHTLYQFWDRFQ